MFEKVWALLLECFARLGEAPLCNGRAERTFKIFGYAFILCYRCTFIIIGLLVGIVLLMTVLKNKPFSKMRFIYKVTLSFMLIIPTMVDGILQYGFDIESTNLRRSLTGFCAGLGFAIIVLVIVTFIERILYKEKTT